MGVACRYLRVGGAGGSVAVVCRGENRVAQGGGWVGRLKTRQTRAATVALLMAVRAGHTSLTVHRKNTGGWLLQAHAMSRKERKSAAGKACQDRFGGRLEEP